MAALLAACQGETVSRNDPNRGNRPARQAVVEELNVKGMTRTSPVLMRIFKEEAELEVWKRDAPAATPFQDLPDLQLFR